MTVNIILKRVLVGAVSGCLATVPMTLFMEAAHAVLPKDEQYPLPPREITEVAIHHANVADQIDEPQTVALTYLAHFGMGAAAGTLYGIVEPLLPVPVVAKGITYGLVVWTGNYLGILPALDILRPATDHPARRNALMITAHIIWGTALGMLTAQVTDGQTRKSVG